MTTTPDETGDGTNAADDSRREPAWRRWLPGRRVLLAGAVALVVLTGGGVVALVGGDDANGGENTDGGAAAAGGETAGGGDADSDAATTEDLTVEEAGQAFVRCMHDNGVVDWPDAEIDENDGIQFSGISELDVPDEELATAQQTCDPILDAVRPGPSGGSEPEGPNIEGGMADPAAAGWEEVVPGGDCQCADGSEYRFWVREADPNRVVFVLGGGGACWSAETCDPQGDNEYVTTADGPSGRGIFDFADERNPFADHSFVYVPYCTADVFLGNAGREYDADLTVQHRGYVNGTAALDHLAATFPDATDVVVIGQSAGSVSAPVYAGLASDLLPDTRITAISDSSAAYPDDSEANGLVADAWGTAASIPDWPANAGLTAGEWVSSPGLFVQSGQHDPDLVFARYDHAYDEEQASRLSLLLGDTSVDLPALMDANEAQIEAAGFNLASYTAPGTGHVVFTNDRFYSEAVDGTALTGWVTRLVGGEPVDDVRCTDCEAE